MPYNVYRITYLVTAAGPHIPVQLRNLEHPRRRRVLLHLRLPRAHRGKFHPTTQHAVGPDADPRSVGPVPDRHHCPHGSKLLAPRLGTIATRGI